MEQIGVAAVVEGLSSFLGDMKKIDSSIQGLVPGTKLLENTFGFLGDTISGFADFALNTLAHALGELVADAIEFLIQKLGELVQSTIEAGGEFQTLELRLSTLNFNAATESGMEFNAAMAESTRLTKEQLDWLMKLAVQTPYDAQDIANVYTLARSYGFADDEAKKLTDTIINFASGMGLGSQEIQRIIVNFGQMVQQGKVTQREMNDLARGSFVPVNDVLKRMATNLGMSTDELEKFRKTAASVPEFTKAFEQLVGERFTGSAEKMARTFQGATANLKDLFKSIGGFNIVKPILDVVGGHIADFITSLTDGSRWDRMVGAAKRVGDSIAGIIGKLFGLMPSADSVAEGVVNALNGIADWIGKNQDKITGFIMNIKKWIDDKLVPSVQNIMKWLFGSEEKEGAFQKFGTWLSNSFVPAVQSAAKWVGDVLIPFLKNDLYPIFVALLPLAAAIGDVLITAFGGQPNQEFTDWIHQSLIPGIEKFTQWIIDNREIIALWVERLVTATIQLALFIGVISLAINTIATVVAAFLDWIVVSGNWVKIAYVLVIVLALIAVGMNGMLIPLFLVVAAIAILVLAFDGLKAFFMALIETFKQGWATFANVAAQAVLKVQDAFKNGDWIGVGKAIVQGIANGIAAFASLVVTAAMNAAAAAVNAVGNRFGLGATTSSSSSSSRSSPSRTSQSYSTTNNSYNLNINSRANSEPIIQDFNLLQSMSGGR